MTKYPSENGEIDIQEILGIREYVIENSNPLVLEVIIRNLETLIKTEIVMLDISNEKKENLSISLISDLKKIVAFLYENKNLEKLFSQENIEQVTHSCKNILDFNETLKQKSLKLNLDSFLKFVQNLYKSLVAYAEENK